MPRFRWPDADDGTLELTRMEDTADVHDWVVGERSFVDGEPGDVTILTPPSLRDDWG